MKIKSVKRISLENPIPVYDITVPETENFKLAAGPIVHNSKDVADAACGVATYLLTRRQSWTTQPTFRGTGGLMLHGHKTGIGPQLEEISEDEFTERHGSGRRSITKRRSVNRLNPKRRKAG